MTELMYHFCHLDNDGLPVLDYSDGRDIKVGETLTVEGPVELCAWGLHASPRIIDALDYAECNTILTAVTLSGEMDCQSDNTKRCATERTCHAMVSESETQKRLCVFARWCALQVAAHWNAPESVLDYLQTGNPVERERSYWLAQDYIYTHNYNALPDYAARTARAAATDIGGVSTARAAARNMIRAIISAECLGNAKDEFSPAMLALAEATRNAQEAKLRELFPELQVTL